MKLVYLVDAFPVLSETFVLREILELQRQGVEVETVALRRSGERIAHPEVAVVRSLSYLPGVRVSAVIAAHVRWLARRPAGYLRALAAFLPDLKFLLLTFILRMPDVQAILDRSPDRIHAAFAAEAAQLAMLCRLLGGPPFTFTSHRFDVFDLPAWNLRGLSSRADVHWTVSEYNRRYLVKRQGVRPADVSVLHVGVDVASLPPAPAWKNRPRRFVCVARLEEVKSVDRLIEACALLRDRQLEFECVLVGDGQLRAQLESLCRARSLGGRVRFAGACTHEQALAWVASSRLMVLPSRSEGIPVSLMEAMALGTGVIATRVCGVPELVEHDRCGWLVEWGDVRSLAGAMERFLDDAVTCTRWAAEARARVEASFELAAQTAQMIRAWGPAASAADASR